MKNLEPRDPWDAPLTKKQLAGLRAQVADLKDRTRWMISSALFGTGWHMLYDVSNDTYLMHKGRKSINAKDVTLFKREALAKAVVAWLHRRDKSRKSKDDLELVKCRVGKDGTKIRLT